MQTSTKLNNYVYNFESLPRELYAHITTFIANPESIIHLAQVNKRMRKIISENVSLLKFTMQIHFPHVYAYLLTLEEEKAVNWYAEFCKTCKRELKDLTKESKELLGLVKTKNLNALIAKNINYTTLLSYKHADSEGRTPFDWMIEKGDSECINYFLQRFISLYTKDKDLFNKEVPAYTAILFNQSLDHIKQKFSVPGTDFNATAPDFFHGNTPLHFAALYCKNSIDFLIANGANINAINGNFLTPLELAIMKGNIDTVACLFKHNPINFAYKSAIKYNRLNILKMLLAHKEATSEDLNNLLPFAAQWQRVEIFDYLLDKIVFPIFKIVDETLVSAICSGSVALLDLIFTKNFGLLQTDISRKIDFEGFMNGSTLLHFAVYYGQVDIVRYLISKGADVNATNAKGATPLHFAALYNKPEMIDIFIKNQNTNFLIQNQDKQTAYKIARSKAKKSKSILPQNEKRKKYYQNAKTTKYKLALFNYIEKRKIKIANEPTTKQEKTLSNNDKLTLANKMKDYFFSDAQTNIDSENLKKEIQNSKKLKKIFTGLSKKMTGNEF